ncbi:MAG: hypothetical protein J6334_07735 [Kiritimatiellae bacterium]|nr:hypothetical protein [Kiritimatiellia bacterium]
MKTKKQRFRFMAGCRFIPLALAIGWIPVAVQAQWMEQSIPLSAGWNAIHLKVNPAETACGTVFSDTKVTQVSWWNRDRLDDGTGSAVTDFCNWYRSSAEPSTFGRVIGGKRYLVKASAATTLKIKGTPAIPNGKIYLGEMNLVGLEVPTYSSDYTTYYEYFTPLNPSLSAPPFFSVNTANASVTLSTSTRVTVPSRAIWVSTTGSGETTYMGPFELALEGGSAVMAWSTTTAARTLAIKNVTAANRKITIKRESSLAPPAGQGTLAGAVEFSIESIDWSAGYARRVYKPLTFPFTTNVAAGATFEFRVRPNLAKMPAKMTAGAAYQSILTISDAGSVIAGETRAEGTCLYRVGARVAGALAASEVNPAGLWVGTVALGEVNRAKMLGSSTPEWDPEALMTAPHPFQFRLIVHVADDGTTKILKQVFTAMKSADAASSDLLTDRETAIAYRGLYPNGSIRRTASANFPFMEPLTLRGGEFMTADAILSATFTQAYDDKTNPFVHAFHPQHDNLAFNNKKPSRKASGDEGVGEYESWGVTREVSLKFLADDPSGAAGDNWNRTVTGGLYTERVSGLIGQGKPIITRGIFRLSKVNDTAELTTQVIH